MVSVSIRMKPKNSKGPVQVNDLVGYNVTEYKVDQVLLGSTLKQVSEMVALDKKVLGDL